jgi:hypothetical protein
VDFEVHSKTQLTAAVQAAACATYEQAKQNPVSIQWGRTRYTFKEGIHERRAKAIVRNINRTRFPKGV